MSLNPSTPCLTNSVTVSVAVPHAWWSIALGRLGDYATLCKPRIVVMGLLVVSAGFSLGLASGGLAGQAALLRYLATLIGIGAVAAACSVFNQCLERDTDARMRRTAQRPLITGRVATSEAWALGSALATTGFLVTLLAVNGLTAFLGGVTLVSYVLAYTPLKRVTSLSTLVGAVPGALPPVLGWTAAGSPLNAEAFSLFAILFLWQFPHLLAIAWIYRDEYRQAGLRLLPGERLPRGAVGLIATGYAAALLYVSLQPRWLGLGSNRYAAVAVLLGLIYFAYSAAFAYREDRVQARRLLACSLIYLPALLAALVWDHWSHFLF